MPIALSGSWTDLDGFDDVLTLSFSASAGERILFVFDAPLPTSITTDGGANTFSQVHSWTNLYAGTSYAYMSPELSGSTTQIIVTWDDANLLIGAAVRLTGVHASSPVGNVGSDSSSDDTPTVSITTTAANEGIFGFIELDGSRVLTPTAGQTAYDLGNMNGFVSYDVDAGAASTFTVGGTLDSNVLHSIGAFALKAAGGGGGGGISVAWLTA